MFSVAIDDRRAIRAADRTAKALGQTHRMLEVVARGFRDDVRDRMNSRDGGNWQAASKWTRAKKNTNRPLAGQARNIVMLFSSPKQALVAYSGVSKETGKPISITEHHFGKTLNADGRLVEIAVRNPAPLRLPTGRQKAYFRWTRNSVVPARKIWPDRPGEANKIAEPLVSRWVRQTTDRTWK